MKNIIALSFLACVLTVSGCASPQIGAHGEQLVWIRSIRVMDGSVSPDSNATSIGSQAASMAVSSPGQAGVVGALFGIGVGLVGAKNSEGKLFIEYSPDKSRLFKTLVRKPWPSSNELQPQSWAILSSDADGRIILPCPGCEPVGMSN